MAKKDTNNNSKYVRAPIVTFMGHVDHGKTSLLDAIRDTSVQKGEYGGITQHVGAYSIEHNSQKITFIDTPGHSAFTQMRARGGKAADVVVLVVAADDGVMPQTKEAIAHAKAANVPMIVAINKMDVAGANPDKVKQQLAQENVLVEDWGGDIVSVEVSAETKDNLDTLLDAILAVSDLLELEADSTDELEAIIIESKKDPKKGVVVNCIIRNGTLQVGDEIQASGLEAKVKRITDEHGQSIQETTATAPVSVLGFGEVPTVGDLIVEQGSELAELAVDQDHVEIIGTNAANMVSIILKADTKGTLEAVKASLADLVTSSVGKTFSLKFIQTSTGSITDSDVLLAQSVEGVVIGFNVAISNSADTLAHSLSIPVKTYKTIYDLLDEAEDLLKWTAEKEEAKIKGRAGVLKLFKLRSGDIVAGCTVMAGRMPRNASVAVYDKNPADVEEDEEPLYRGRIKKVQSGTEEVSSIGKGNECGIMLKPQFEDIKPGMFIEVV
ncbi:translation initiation factor IF-2 [candidate division WWE3 bacterium]|nr:translation initiation factor IF-2 [candidate division WWE3 bacterium]